MMYEISFEWFIEQIKNDSIIKNTVININSDNIVNLEEVYNSKIEIYDCIFKGNDLIIYDNYSESESNNNDDLYKIIKIHNCSIENLTIENCSLKELDFRNLKLSGFNVSNCIAQTIKIHSFKDINYNFKISKLKTLLKTEILGNDFIENGKLSIFDSNFHNSLFIESKFNNLLFQSCFFTGYFDFNKNAIHSNNERFQFENCSFEKTNFNETTFSKDTNFNDCKFFKTATFNDINNVSNSELNFTKCEFNKHVQFNYASLFELYIENVKFNEMVSFQEVKVGKIFIDRTVFEKGALFDDIQILKITDCDIRTIRNIKQQLQKAENKIDYNRFRVFEFNAYRKEIKKKLEKSKSKVELTQLKSDSFVLWISELVSDYGTDWKRALNFTILSGLSIYMLFYSIENYNHSIEISNWDNWTKLISGLFRFFLVTDFYNPLETDRVYLTNPLSWFIFILGKIAIAFGIYEMIQSFRKFKS